MKTRVYRIDWAAVYAAFVESGAESIAEFYRNRMVAFVPKGEMPSLKTTYYRFKLQRRSPCARNKSPVPSVRRVHPIRKFGPRLQFATLDDDILDAGCQPATDSCRKTAAVSVTMHVRLANGTELAFATADPEKFASDLIIKTAGLT